MDVPRRRIASLTPREYILAQLIADFPPYKSCLI
jgi:hypothetical protein